MTISISLSFINTAYNIYLLTGAISLAFSCTNKITMYTIMGVASVHIIVNFIFINLQSSIFDDLTSARKKLAKKTKDILLVIFPALTNIISLILLGLNYDICSTEHKIIIIMTIVQAIFSLILFFFTIFTMDNYVVNERNEYLIVSDKLLSDTTDILHMLDRVGPIEKAKFKVIIEKINAKIEGLKEI